MKIISAKIEVMQATKDSTITSSKKGDLFFTLKAKVIFRRCRVAQSLTYTPMAKAVWCQPLTGYSGSANIRPEDWLKWIDTVPVETVPDYWEDAQVIITPEIEKQAKDRIKGVATCPAITQDCHPSYQPEFDEIEY